MSSAILATLAVIDPQNVTDEVQNPSFRLSSAFPYFKDIYFLPRAATSQAVRLPEDRLKQAKKLKKVQWLDCQLWRASLTDANWVEQINLDVGICQSVLASRNTIMPERLWVEEERPRLAMDRQSNQALEGQIFNFSRIWFHPEGGLYFLVVFDDEASRKKFETSLSVLGDSGIGADRSNGNGCFSWVSGKMPDLKLAGDEKAIALSLVNPAPSDCQTGWLDSAAYKLISRGGWVGGSGIRKQRLRMFAEGSVFARPLQGRMVNVSVDRLPQKVYRDGRGFFVKAG